MTEAGGKCRRGQAGPAPGQALLPVGVQQAVQACRSCCWQWPWAMRDQPSPQTALAETACRAERGLGLAGWPSCSSSSCRDVGLWQGQGPHNHSASLLLSQLAACARAIKEQQDGLKESQFQQQDCKKQLSFLTFSGGRLVVRPTHVSAKDEKGQYGMAAVGWGGGGWVGWDGRGEPTAAP